MSNPNALVGLLRSHDDERLYREADILMSLAADEIERLQELARRAQPEGESPQDVTCARCDGVGAVSSGARTVLCDACNGGGELRPAATLSPLCGAQQNVELVVARLEQIVEGCDNASERAEEALVCMRAALGAQHAEDGKEVEQELRSQMAFIAAYDANELDGGDSQEGMRAADRLACIIRRARKTLDVCDALAAQQAAAQGTVTDYGTSAPGTPEAPHKTGKLLYFAWKQSQPDSDAYAPWYRLDDETKAEWIERAAQLDGGQEGSERG